MIRSTSHNCQQTAAEEIGKGNLNYEMGSSGAKDELGKLSRSFDQMRSVLKQSQEGMWMSTVGQVAASLIHDFRAPMKEILSAIDQIQRAPLDEEKKKARLRINSQRCPER